MEDEENILFSVQVIFLSPIYLPVRACSMFIPLVVVLREVSCVGFSLGYILVPSLTTVFNSSSRSFKVNWDA